MTAQIRSFGADDLDLALPAFLAMERYYEGENAVDEVTARSRLDYALSRKRDNIYLGAFTDRMIGLAMVCEMFPGPDLSTLWYLKHLFVLEEARGASVGEQLLRAAAGEVVARGGTRLAFTTEDKNLGSNRFYDRLGAARIPNSVRGFDGDALMALAGK